MHRYLPVIILVQLVTAALLWASLDSPPKQLLLQFGLPAMLVAVVTALWFASIGRMDSERVIAKLKLQHAKEREKLHVNAEKTKSKVIEQSHKEIRKHEKRIGRKASLKVGLAFFSATAVGVLFVITEFLMFGLMTITTSLGGLGGYLLRARQSYGVKTTSTVPEIRVIDGENTNTPLPAPESKVSVHSD